jgi:hypothetical protein
VINVTLNNTRIANADGFAGSMQSINIELSLFGLSYFLVDPVGKVWPVFIRLPIELRRRLNSSLPDAQVIALAIQRHWVIIKLQRTTVKTFGIAQKYRAEVLADRRTFGGKLRSFASTMQVLRQMEQYAAHPLPIRVRLFGLSDGKAIEVDSHLSSSTDFARIFIHTQQSYNRPLEEGQKFSPLSRPKPAPVK